MKIAALIVAGGTGTRVGASCPKQYLSISGQTILEHTLDVFQHHPKIDMLQLVVHPDYLQDKFFHDKLLPPVAGGATRQASVYQGLQALSKSCPNLDYVLIHDAARPNLKRETISQIIQELTQHKSGILPAHRIVDTLRRGDKDLCTDEDISRDDLWAAQTPQSFPFAKIYAAHQKFKNQNFSDDTKIYSAAGYPTRLLEAPADNFKITTADDVEKFRILKMSQTHPFPDIRTGSGYDVHKFVEGDHVILCGIKIPHPFKLSGHSDADVAMHALTDALYGALAEGDIGVHFPPSDPQWKGAASDIFLKHAVDLVSQHKGIISNIDITLICEAPKISPWQQKMRENLASLMSLDVSRISVKATTSEKLGFTGRKEGIAAHAIATLILERS